MLNGNKKNAKNVIPANAIGMIARRVQESPVYKGDSWTMLCYVRNDSAFLPFFIECIQ